MSAKTRRPPPVATSLGDKLGVPSAAPMSRQTSASSHTSTTADVNPRHASPAYPAPPSATTPGTDSWVAKLRTEIREREKPNLEKRLAEVEEKNREAKIKIERDPNDLANRLLRLEDYTRKKRLEVLEQFRADEEDEVNLAKALRASSGDGNVNLEADEDMVRTQKEILEQIARQQKPEQATRVDASPTASSYPYSSAGVAPQARRMPSAQSVTSKRSYDAVPPRRGSTSDSLPSDPHSTIDEWQNGSPDMYEEDQMLDPVNEEPSDDALEDYQNYLRGDRLDHDDGTDSEDDYGDTNDDSDGGASMVSAFLHNAEQFPPKSNARTIGGRNLERNRSASIGKTPPSLAQYGMYPSSSTTTPVKHQSSRGNLNQAIHQVWKPASSDQMRSGAGVSSRPIPIPSQQLSQTAGFPKRQPSMNMTDIQGRQRQGSRDADTLWEHQDDAVRARARSGSTSGAAAFSASALPGTSSSPRSSSASFAAGHAQAPAQTTAPRRWTPGESQQRTPAPPVSSHVHANGGGASASPAGVYRQRNNSDTSSGVGGRSMSPARRPSLTNAHYQAPHTPSPKPSSSMAIPGGISNTRRISAESPPSTAPVNIPARAAAGSRASASSFSSSPFVPPPSSSLGTSHSHRSASPPPRFVMLERLPTELVEPEPVNVATTSVAFGLTAGAGKGKLPAFNMRATGRKEEDWEAGAKSAGQRTPNGSRPPSALSGRMAQEKEREAAKGKEKEVAVPEDREEDEVEEAPKAQGQTKVAAKKMKGKKKSGQGAKPVPTSATQPHAANPDSQPPAPEDIDIAPPATAASQAQIQLISDLEAKVSVLTAEIAALHVSHASERRNLEDSTASLKTSLESQLASVTSAHTQSETKISSLLTQIDEQREKEKEREKKLKEDAAALKKAHKELEKAHKDLEKAKEREAEARREVEEQKKLRKEAEEKVKKTEEERRKASDVAVKLRKELEAERKKVEDAEMRASEEAVKRQEEAVKRESEDAERKTREEMEKKQRAVEEKRADLERRRKEKEAESLRKEMEEREAALKRREESLERKEESLEKKEESLERKEEEWAKRIEEEEARRLAEEEERRRREEATTEEDEEEEEGEEEDDEDEDEDEEAERAAAARLEAQRLEERAQRQKAEREKAFQHRREDSERRRREHQRELEENREREERNRREAEENDRIRRHEREQRERTTRRREPAPPPPPSVQEDVDEDGLLIDGEDVEAQKKAFEYYEMQNQRSNLKDAKTSSAGASYAKGWNNTNFPGRATSASSSAPSNVSQRSTTSNTSTSTAASDFSRASGTSSATSWSGSSSSGGTARPTPTPKSTGNWKPSPAAASSGSAGGYGAGMGMGASPGSYTNSSPLSDAEWARRQEENARRQQEAFMRENARMEQEKAARAAASAMNASGGRAAVAQLWAQYESAWATLKDRPALFFGTMPWPVLKPPADPDALTANAISAFVLSTAHSQGKGNRDRIKEQLMRWHPDKFESKWMGKVVEAEKDDVRRGAGAVVRGLNELMARESSF